MPRIVVTGAGSPTDNHQPLIQQAIDAVEAAGGGIVYIPDGTHYIGPANGASTNNGAHSLQLGDNVHLQLGVNATLVRRSNGGDVFNATIRNKNPAGNVNIKVSGGIIKTDNSQNVGKHLGFEKVTGLVVEGVQFLGVEGDWNTAFIDCQDVTISNLVMNSGTAIFNDGLHFLGGQRIVIDNCIIHCGDDAISLTQEFRGTGPEAESIATTDLTDVVISNCYLWGAKANVLKMFVADNQTLAIRRIRVSNVVAKVGDASELGQGIVIADLSNSNLVSDIEIDGVWLDASQNGGQAVDIDNARRVRLHRLYVLEPGSRIDIAGSSDIELSGCIVDTPDGLGSQCVLVSTSSNIRIVGGCYKNAKQHGIQIGSDSQSVDVDVFEISNVRVTGAANSGICIVSGRKGTVSGNHCRDNTNGIIEVSPSNANAFLANNLMGNTVAGLSYNTSNSKAAANAV